MNVTFIPRFYENKEKVFYIHRPVALYNTLCIDLILNSDFCPRYLPPLVSAPSLPRILRTKYSVYISIILCIVRIFTLNSYFFFLINSFNELTIIHYQKRIRVFGDRLLFPVLLRLIAIFDKEHVFFSFHLNTEPFNSKLTSDDRLKHWKKRAITKSGSVCVLLLFLNFGELFKTYLL